MEHSSNEQVSNDDNSPLNESYIYSMVRLTRPTFTHLWNALYDYDSAYHSKLVPDEGGVLFLTHDVIQKMWYALLSVHPDKASHLILYGHLDDYPEHEEAVGICEVIWKYLICCGRRKRIVMYPAIPKYPVVIPLYEDSGEESNDNEDDDSSMTPSPSYTGPENDWHISCALLRDAPQLSSPMESEIWREACAKLRESPPLATPNVCSQVSPTSSGYSSGNDIRNESKKVVVCGTTNNTMTVFARNLMQFDKLTGISGSGKASIIHGTNINIWSINEKCSRENRLDLLRGADSVLILHGSHNRFETKLATTYWGKICQIACPYAKILYIAVNSENVPGNVSPATLPKSLSHVCMNIDLKFNTGYQAIIDRIMV